MAASLPNAALLAGGRIGKYFGIVTMLPTLFLVLWAYVLLSADAWHGAPDLEALRVRLADWSVTKIAWLLLATLILALFLHPLQFTTVQLLEGYWGASPVALGAMRLRVMHHRKRVLALADRALDRADDIDWKFEQWEDFSTDWDKDTWSEKKNEFLDTAEANPVLPQLVSQQALVQRRQRYPDVRRVLPTRLGNVMRLYEDSAGRQYGLEAIATAPHFWLIVPEPHRAYVRDSRQLLDTTVRLCFVSLLATLLTVLALLTDGLWLLIALVPYGFAYIAYRAAISAADEYGTAVATVIDLDRFALYESR